MPTHPLLYQVNTRVWIQLLSKQLNRPATLDDIPDSTLDEIASLEFDWIYFLGVWQDEPFLWQIRSGLKNISDC